MPANWTPPEPADDDPMEQFQKDPAKMSDTAEDLAAAVEGWSQTQRAHHWVSWSKDAVEGNSPSSKPSNNPMTQIMVHEAAIAIYESTESLIRYGATAASAALEKKGLPVTPLMAGIPGLIASAYIASTGPLFERFVNEIVAYAKENKELIPDIEKFLADQPTTPEEEDSE